MTELDKMATVCELQANLLLRLIPNLSEADQRDVLVVHEKAQAVLDGKLKKAPQIGGKKNPGGKKRYRKVTRQRGKERDRED